MKQKIDALKAAFPQTIPIMMGFACLGMSYGFLMTSKGFPIGYPILMSALIFAGSMEFVTVDLLLSAFQPLSAFLLALMVNARHLFYGISMLEKFRGTGKKKWYLIFGMCDESFSINCTMAVPEGVDRGWYFFFVTLLNQGYWVLSAAIGAVLGRMVRIQIKGVEFVLTALFVVMFVDQWMDKGGRKPAILGIVVSVVCLIVFGRQRFIIPAMGCMVLGCLLMKGWEEKKR